MNPAKKLSWGSLVAACALVLVALYVAEATGVIDLPRRITLLWALGLGPLAIVGILSISDKLKDTPHLLVLQSARVFGIAAFVLWETVVTIQSGSRIFFREHLIPGAADEAAQHMLKMSYQAANVIQVTMDVAFDIFYCLAILLFSILMYRHRDFGRLVGLLGIISSTGLLVLNLWSFPVPPAEAGLVDLGPLTGVWWIVVIVQLFRKEKGPGVEP